MGSTGEAICGTAFCSVDDNDLISRGQQVGNKVAGKKHKSPSEPLYVSVGQREMEETISGNLPFYMPNLPSELNIFNELPIEVISRPDTKNFLLGLEKVIVHEYHESSLINLSLPKLRVGDVSQYGFVLDWIFDYFRMYFSFDDIDGNYWGMVMVNNDEGEFSNSVIRIQPGKETQLAQTVIDNVITFLGCSA